MEKHIYINIFQFKKPKNTDMYVKVAQKRYRNQQSKKNTLSKDFKHTPDSYEETALLKQQKHFKNYPK